MKRLIYATTLLGFAFSVPSQALEVESKCPLTVKSNTPLVVPTTISNNDCKKKASIEKVIAGLAGNGGGTIGIQGPFVKELTTPKTVPKATCKTYTYPGCTLGPQYCSFTQVLSPGTLTLNLTIVSKTPTALNNTLALASTGVMQADGKATLGACYLTVTP